MKKKNELKKDPALLYDDILKKYFNDLYKAYHSQNIDTKTQKKYALHLCKVLDCIQIE